MSARRRRRPTWLTVSIAAVLAFLATFSLAYVTADDGLSAALVAAPAPPPTSAPPVSFVSGQLVHVARVIDGDTFELDGGLRVRVLVMDSCELRTPGGRAALAAATELLGNQWVTIARDGRNRDRDDRLLRHVTLPDGSDFAQRMLVGDHTAVYTGRHDSSAERVTEGARLDRNGRSCG